ncbi:hypothetical protein K461DRAFT_278302 [Myriangium duriaei CBS 260.36]|uniref:Putative gamma-glutamylcyclotransferase n=1 Tax=Myriangium duriaei CBS 260.36 TaxID=1168546 RepID=A0A9P4MHS8_9PEZI|nr:hypothetical protein K461DRAFT_278302 [Myriangium duriaei CBS 260.36]
MGDNTLFFYGTLLSPSILSRVIHGPSNPTFTPSNTYILNTPAVLPSHQRHRVRHADYPAIIPSALPTASVRGTLASHLTDMDVRRLDIFEGDEYTRRRVTVRTEKGDEVQAETYIWTAGRERLENEEWDFDAFVREKMKFWLGGETGRKEFGAVDEAVAEMDGTGGRRLDGEMGRELERETSVGKAREVVESAV